MVGQLQQSFSPQNNTRNLGAEARSQLAIGTTHAQGTGGARTSSSRQGLDGPEPADHAVKICSPFPSCAALVEMACAQRDKVGPDDGCPLWMGVRNSLITAIITTMKPLMTCCAIYYYYLLP